MNTPTTTSLGDSTPGSIATPTQTPSGLEQIVSEHDAKVTQIINAYGEKMSALIQMEQATGDKLRDVNDKMREAIRRALFHLDANGPEHARNELRRVSML